MSDDELELRINGESRLVPRNCTVRELLTTLGMGERRIAVAINRAVVPRSSYASLHLTDGDRVEILEAVGGG